MQRKPHSRNVTGRADPLTNPVMAAIGLKC